MKNTRNLKNAMMLLVFALAALYACRKEGSAQASSSGPSHATIYLTDHQTPVFDSVFIDIQKLEVKIEDSNTGNEGWITLAVTPGVYNILRLSNGIDTLFANGNLPNNQLRKLRLTLGTHNSVVKNGQSFPLSIKDNDREVVANLESSNFDVDGNGHVLFWIDFDAGNSIVTDNSGSGNNNGFALKPHIRIFTRSKSGRIEGRISPLAADPVVMAIRGTDTATAIPDHHDGEFKIIGLNAGTYKLVIDGQNGYLDSTINNVIVSTNEDTHIPTVVLHQ
jgi:hypothetical protein